MSMSRVPWSTFARCRVRLAMVDIRPPIGDDGRHSTVDLSRPEFQSYMSNDDFSRSHLSSGPMARFAAPSGLSATLPLPAMEGLPVIRKRMKLQEGGSGVAGASRDFAGVRSLGDAEQ